MEHLLALAIDNVSSRSTTKIRKGLRQIEGLLAQICLSSSTYSSPSKSPYQNSTSTSLESQSPFERLAADPAYLEFFRLQHSFEYNLASKLLSTLSLLLAMTPSDKSEDLILSTLGILHGTLLLHPPSRSLFSREGNTNLILELINPALHSAPTICASLLVLLVSLIEHPNNARTFEASNGLAQIAELLKNPKPEVYRHAEEVLQFYLMPEASDTKPSIISRAPSYESTTGGVMLPPSSSPSRLPSTETPTKTSPTKPHQRSPSKASFRESAQLNAPTGDTSPTKQPRHSHQRSTSKVSSIGSGRSWSSQASMRVTRSCEEKRALLSVYVDLEPVACS